MRAREAGDHYIVEHADHGMLPIYKSELAPEEEEHLRRLAKGGDVGDGGEEDDSKPQAPEKSKGPQIPQKGTPEELFAKGHGTELSPAEQQAIIDGNADHDPSQAPPVPTSIPINDAGISAIDTSNVPIPASARADAARLLAQKQQPVATTTVDPNGTVQIQHYGPPAPAPVVIGAVPPHASPTGQPAIATTAATPTGPASPSQVNADIEALQSAPAPPNAADAVGPTIDLPPKPGASPTAARVNADIANLQNAPAAPPVEPEAPLTALGPETGGAPGAGTDLEELNRLQGQIGSGETRQEQAAKATRDAENQLAKETADVQGKRTTLLQNMANEFQGQADKLTQDLASYRQAALVDIDPLRHFKESPWWANTLSILGLGAGTFGAALAHSPNTAAEIYQKSIDNDLEAQYRNQTKNLDLARLTLQERQQLNDTFQMRKAFALETAAAAIDAAAARAAPGLNRGEYLKTTGILRQKAAELGMDVLKNRIFLQYEAPLKQQDLLEKQLQFRGQIQGMNFTRHAIGLPLLDEHTGKPIAGQPHPGQIAPALHRAGVPPALIPTLIQKAIGDVGEYGTIVPVPVRDPKSGAPISDPGSGQVAYDDKNFRILQDKGQKGEVLNKVSFLQKVQEPVSELRALLAAHPDGTLDPAETEKAQALSTRISTVLTEAQSGASRLSEADINLSHQLVADLGIISAQLGKSPVRVEQLQHTLDSGWRSLEPYFLPKAWVQALYEAH